MPRIACRVHVLDRFELRVAQLQQLVLSHSPNCANEGLRRGGPPRWCRANQFVVIEDRHAVHVAHRHDRAQATLGARAAARCCDISA